MPIHILREVPVFVSERATSCVRSHSTGGVDPCVRLYPPHRRRFPFCRGGPMCPPPKPTQGVQIRGAHTGAPLQSHPVLTRSAAAHPCSRHSPKRLRFPFCSPRSMYPLVSTKLPPFFCRGGPMCPPQKPTPEHAAAVRTRVCLDIPAKTSGGSRPQSDFR